MPTGTRFDPFIKDPDSIRSFGINWATFLDGQAFTATTWTLTSGTAVIDSNTTSTTYTLVKLSGGAAGERCVLRNRVTRTDGERDDQTIYVRIREK